MHDYGSGVTLHVHLHHHQRHRQVSQDLPITEIHHDEESLAFESELSHEDFTP